MKRITKKQKEWLWFIGLWIGGFSALFVVSKIIHFALLHN
ncbi:MAG: DUF2474 domain-containing protein [Gammaproteobacteria bacterium]